MTFLQDVAGFLGDAAAGAPIAASAEMISD
jgi:hypothetical protein